MTKPGEGNSSSRPDSRSKARSPRFTRGADALVEAYTSSIEQDLPLLPHDVAGSRAHAAMLGRQGIIEQADADRVVAGLSAIGERARTGSFVLRDDLEDVHMNIEAELEREIGPAAGRLHTARSRNDQVITDFRLLVREGVLEILDALEELETVVVDIAEREIDVIMPGYTHLQLAQPVLLAHHLMAYQQMFSRDRRRFAAVLGSVADSPLGAGALAGVPYPIDRVSVAEELGFSGVTANSMDSVSDRDFLIEFHAAAAICMMHISRLAEEIVLWSTREFGFITLDDAFATGSSIMPQKKNPDVAELARGRTGQIYGNLFATLTMMKALPLTYNRDMQADKPPFLDSHSTLTRTLRVFAAMLPAISWNAARMRAAAGAGYSLATDVADYLVRKRLPFREAHHVVGSLVRYGEEQEKDLPELSLAEYRRFSELFEDDVLQISLESSVNSRAVTGGTARLSVLTQIERARAALTASAHTAPAGDGHDRD